MGNFKVKCVSGYSGHFTKGKVYDVINGCITGDNNVIWEGNTSVDYMNDTFVSQFELVVKQNTFKFNKSTIYTVLERGIRAKMEEDKTIVSLDKKEENMRFKKEDLQLFNVVKLRNNQLYLYSEINDGKFLTGITSADWREINYVDEDEIISVFEPKSNKGLNDLLYSKNISGLILLWEENQQVELTLDEIAEKFGVKVENLKIKK